MEALNLSTVEMLTRLAVLLWPAWLAVGMLFLFAAATRGARGGLGGLLIPGQGLLSLALGLFFVVAAITLRFSVPLEVLLQDKSVLRSAGTIRETLVEYVGLHRLAIALVAFGQLWPAWLAVFLVMVPSYVLRDRLGLYGRIYYSGVGSVGLAIVLFWIAVALCAPWIITFDPFVQNTDLCLTFLPQKALEWGRLSTGCNQIAGVIDPSLIKPHLFGTDNVERDIFSRMVWGSRLVLWLAPAATAMAYIVGMTLGVAAGYLRGLSDGVLSFLANLILAFPVLLLLLLMTTPGIRETGILQSMAGVLFVFPLIFLFLILWSRYRLRQAVFLMTFVPVFLIWAYAYAGLVFSVPGAPSMAPTMLNVFIAVAFASSPGVFRIVRGLALDIKTRDYVAAAETRGEGPWYIMLWEVLPNARGPLIVDACLRIGYTTILLGTLGLLGIGIASDSPDWGSMIAQIRQFLQDEGKNFHVFPPALALLSLVLGLNLLADGLREQSLKD